MIKLKYISLFAAIMLVFVGCSNGELELEKEMHVLKLEMPEFVNDLEDNEVAFNGNIIKVQNKITEDDSYDIVEIQQTKEDIIYRAKRISSKLFLENKGLKTNKLEEALREIEGEQLFYFEFEENLKRDLIKKYFESNLNKSVSYLAFGINNDFKIINTEGDTILCNSGIYERNFHVAPFERVLLSFTGVDQGEEIQLIYHDKLFGKGKFSFAFASTNYITNNIKNPS